jgi:hypothetical protein
MLTIERVSDESHLPVARGAEDQSLEGPIDDSVTLWLDDIR